MISLIGKVYRRAVPKRIRKKYLNYENGAPRKMRVVEDHPKGFSLLRGWKERPFFSGVYVTQPDRYANYEPEETELFEKEVKPGSVLIDIGANVGYFTLLVAKRCEKIIAFEPENELFSILNANLALNGIENVQTFRLGLFNKNEVAHIKSSRGKVIRENSDEFKLKEQDKKAIEKGGAGIHQISLRRFDDLHEELGIDRIDFVKIDIEGAEVDALLGMDETIKKYHPALCLGVHPQKMKPFNRRNGEIHEFLKRHGYQYRIVSSDGDGKGLDTADYSGGNYTLYCW